MIEEVNEWKESKLTPKQEAFAQAIAVQQRKDASAAYRSAYDWAGMKPATVNRKAKELMDNGKIAARIAELSAPGVMKTEIAIERVLAEYAKIAFTDLPSIVTFDGRSMSIKDFDKLTPDQRACIKKFKVRTEVKLMPDGEKVPVDVVEVELHSKQAALDSIAKHLGMFIDRKEVTGMNGGPVQHTFNLTVLTDEQLMRKAVDLSKRVGLYHTELQGE